MNSLMRFRGQPIEIRDRNGRMHRGIMDGLTRQEGEYLLGMDLEEEEDLFLSF